MAKRRHQKHAKKARRPRRRTPRVSRKRVARRHHKRHARKSVALKSIRITGMRNPHRRHHRRRSNPVLSGVKGMFRMPTVQELIWVTVGGLGLPTVTRFITDKIPVDALKGGWGNIATELVIGSAASGLARKYAGGTAGDVLFILTLARFVGRAAHQFNPAIGLAAGDDALAFYNPMDYSGQLPGFSSGDEQESMVD